jgi:hypothetical protein
MTQISSHSLGAGGIVSSDDRRWSPHRFLTAKTQRTPSSSIAKTIAFYCLGNALVGIDGLDMSIV